MQQKQEKIVTLENGDTHQQQVFVWKESVQMGLKETIEHMNVQTVLKIELI
jgi:hypothetical protein